MNRLSKHTQALYELRFSPMCKPAAEVANLTQLESQHVRARTMIMWRIAAGHLEWGPREIEIIYQSTLDSISEAFDVFHYPVSRYMLDARAEIWEAGQAPQNIKEAVEKTADCPSEPLPEIQGDQLFLAGELFQVQRSSYEEIIAGILKDIPIWRAAVGVLPFVLGAREYARSQAESIIKGISDAGIGKVILDGPETAWGLMHMYSELGLEIPGEIEYQLLSTYLWKNTRPVKAKPGKIFFHDSRPACLLAEEMPGHLAIIPGYLADEEEYGRGEVYDAPRLLVDAMGRERVFGRWTRCMAKSCGADDGLWVTYPELAEGLARQRLAYARELGAERIVTDSPLCADYLSKQSGEGGLPVDWLPELIAS